MKKTNIELVEDIRRSGQAIDENWDWAFCLSGAVNLGGLEKVESHANALAIYCKLLRQRLEAGQATQEGGTWPNAMPIHVTLKQSDATLTEGE